MFDPLHTAAKDGDLDKIKSILADKAKFKGIDIVNAPDKHRRTPLHLAAFYGKAEAAEKLIEAGADVGKEAMDGFLPLHFAAQQGHIELLRVIIRSVSAKGDHGAVKRLLNRVITKGKKSALHLAVMKGHSECACFLATKGASVEMKTSGGQTALDLCKTDVLRRDLAGKGAEATAADEAEKALAAASGPSAGESGGEPDAKRAKVADGGTTPTPSPAPAPAPAGAPAALPPMAGLPVEPSAAAKAIHGVLACGPFALEHVQVSVAPGVKSYPSGSTPLANVHWSFAIREQKGLKDGPVWCVMSHEVTEGDAARVLKMHMQKSSQKMLVYTHNSDEGKLLPGTARCNACFLTLLAEASDGVLAIEEAPGVAIDNSDLRAALQNRLEGFGCAGLAALAGVSSARVLGLVQPAFPGPHELVVGVRLSDTSSAQLKVATAPLHVGSLEELLSTAAIDQAAPARRGLELLSALRAQA